MHVAGRVAALLLSLFAFSESRAAMLDLTVHARNSFIVSPHVSTTCGPPHLSYLNGALVTNVQVVPVFWGNSIDPSITTNIPQFFSDLTVSNWYDMLSEYASVGGTNQSIGRGSAASAVTIGTEPPTFINDGAIQTWLGSQITGGVLPQPQQDSAGNTDTVYVVYFPSSTTISVSSGGGTLNSCTGFGGYHNDFAFGINNVVLPYAVIPSCPGFLPGQSLLDEVMYTSSHEVAEVVTDVDLLGVASGNAWYWYESTDCSGEIADICDNGVPAPFAVEGRSWIATQLWSNALNACVGTGLTPSYAVSASGPASAGSPFTFTVTAKNPSGNQGTDIAYVGTVHFTSSDPDAVLPPDFTYIPEDRGAYGFSATLFNPGAQTITATDTLNGNIVGSSAPITVAGSSQCSGANNYTIPFFDDFPGSTLNPNHWSANANGGTITVADNSVALSGSPFPYVTASGSPIPAAGDFSVRWIATYGAQQPAGTGSLAITNSLPANGDGSWLDVADAWQDSSGYRVQVQNPAGAQSSAYSDVAPGIVQHDVEYCWLSNTLEVYVDGVQKLQQSRDAGVPRPTTLWFGNPSNSTNAWQPFTLNHVEVRSLNDQIFRNGFGG